MTRQQYTEKIVGSNGDGSSNSQATMLVYNGSTSDRLYNNTQGTLLASSARTAGIQTAIQTNYNAKGVVIYLNVTVASGTGGIAPRIISFDPVTSTIGAINVAASVASTGEYLYILYPGITTGSSVTNTQIQQTTNALLPRQWGINMNATDASSYTYSVAYSLIL